MFCCCGVQVPMAGQICGMLHLCGKLAAAVSAVLEAPSCAHSKAVQDAVRTPADCGCLGNRCLCRAAGSHQK